jgi:hypothetical protein
MDQTCDINWGMTRFFKNLKERGRLEGLSVDGIQLANTYEYGNEHLGFIKGGKFID